VTYLGIAREAAEIEESAEAVAETVSAYDMETLALCTETDCEELSL
jgi:hypothetical protein